MAENVDAGNGAAAADETAATGKQPGNGKKPLTDDQKNAKREKLVSSQAEYHGTDHHERVQVTFTGDTKYHRKGTTAKVHPTTALLFKAKGIIDGWKDLPNNGKYIEPEVKKKKK